MNCHIHPSDVCIAKLEQFLKQKTICQGLKRVCLSYCKGMKIKNDWISAYYKTEIQSLSMGLSMLSFYFFGFNSSKIIVRRFSIGTRTCCIVSRSRTVTVLSTNVSLSTVTHIGVPMAS